MRRKINCGGGLEIECLEIDDSQLSLPDIPASRDPATELVGSILAGLGSNTMDTDTLNNTFAELGTDFLFHLGSSDTKNGPWKVCILCLGGERSRTQRSLVAHPLENKV